MASLTRRSLIKTSALGALAASGGWVVAGRTRSAAGAVALPPGVPGPAPFRQQFRNWAGDVVTEPLWTVVATGEAHVVQLANWAHANNFRLRPKGFSHNWSPLAVDPGSADARVLMVDTRRGLARVSYGSRTVTAGAGVSMDTLLSGLDWRRRGLAHHPAPGNLTLGGVLAIGGHGAATARAGERLSTGHSYGSLSNLVTSLRAVVWDSASGAYVARTFARNQRETGALLVNLSRAFITQATLRVGPSQKVRCQSITGISARELLGPEGSGRRTVSRYLNASGRVEVIWFPFTDYPWFKVWTVTGFLPPIGSVPVLGPYNYAFADGSGIFGLLLPDPERVYANPGDTPNLMRQQATAVPLALTATLTRDIWGSGPNVMRYVRPSTIKVTANGYAILCRRADVQWVINTFTTRYTQMLNSYAAQGRYPVNGPMEIRVMGVDNPADSGVSGGVDPWLSPTRRRPDHPEWDTVVYLDLLTMPFTPGRNPFYAEYEQYLFATFNTSRTGIRVEWSKGWGYDASAGAYQSSTIVDHEIPVSLSTGQPDGTGFWAAMDVLDSLDPHRIYSSPLLERLTR